MAGSGWRPNRVDLQGLIAPLASACRDAGAAIRRVRRAGVVAEEKADRSPVTVADRAAEAILLQALAQAAPDIPVVAEEEAAAGRVPPTRDTFFLVDPLDGTREFIRGGDDYTVNIGLIVGGIPTLGLIFVPEQARLWGGLVGVASFVEDADGRRPIRVRRQAGPLVAVASKSHLDEATQAYLTAVSPEAETIGVGSSLKFCLIAEGRADLYPRCAPTSEWDTAAGHAILLAAGGRVDGLDGTPLAYGKPGYRNRGFVATSGWQAPALGPFMRDGD